jgi:5-formyltetrahydrofolate cyclo-ligase
LQEPDLKATLRNEALSKRDSVPLPVRKIKDSAIAERLLTLDTFRESQVVLLYASFRSEVDTEGVIKKALEMGKKVLLPRVNLGETQLDLYEINSLDELSPGYMGIPEPDAKEENLRGLEDVGVAVLPGAAFDSKGSRLGYGKGYYDRLLSEGGVSPVLVALAYEEQVLENIPSETHDVKMDIILTDRRLISCKGIGNGQEKD